jgi:hypothetical protein
MTQIKLVVALAVSGVLGGVVGALTLSALAAGEGESSVSKERAGKTANEEVANEEGGDVSGNEDIAARMKRLEAQLRTLERATKTNHALEEYSRALKKKREASDGGEQTDDELAPVVDGEDPTFELAVRTVMDRVDWEKNEERRVTEDREREERAERQTELLTERLRLTAAQRPKLQAVLTEQMGAFRALRSGDAGVPRPATRSEWRVQVDRIRAETEKKLEEVLDEAQMQQYKQWIAEEAWDRGRGRRDDRGER